MFKKLASLCALASIATFAAVGCSAETDTPAEEPAAAVQDDELRKSITACKVDDDCVAVPRGGCCDNGWKEAVNKHHTKAYANATKCTLDPRPMCPMYIVNDTRVAQCNPGTKQCEMATVEDIKCGGFVANPHHCPTGYSCVVKGNPDLPGHCVKDAVPTDCRTNGCGANQWCSACWGKFACIPKGAMC